MVFARDPLVNPFNEWLKSNALFISLIVAAVLLIIVGVLLILNVTKKGK